MAKILFTHSYFLKLDHKQFQSGNAYPPLGTIVAAALLRENGYQVALHDTMLSDSPNQLLPSIQEHSPDYLVIYDDSFNYLTKMCLTNMREAAFRMIQLAKQQGCKVIISSSDSTDHFELYLNKQADYVILGEGDASLLELIQHLEAGKDVSNVQGISYIENGQAVRHQKRPVQKDLDLLPLPAWDLVEIEPYRKLWQKKQGYFSLNMVTSRGCTYKCNWCAKPLFGNRYHVRTPANVVEELKLLVQVFKADHIWFCDDIFGLKPGWLDEFATLVEQANLKFTFKIQSRADLMTKEVSVKALAKAGCDTVWIGAESGSQKILDAMEKGIQLAEIHTSRNLLRKYGIKAAFFLQFGYPGETKEDIKATVDMVWATMPEEIGISVTYPLPDTKLFEMVKQNLHEKSNWKDSDELAMMFENTFPKAYYKELQRYVHAQYRYRKARQVVMQGLKRPMQIRPSTFRKALSFSYNLGMAYWLERKLNNIHQGA